MTGDNPAVMRGGEVASPVHEEGNAVNGEEVEIRLHFIGKRFYTRRKFVEEARRYEVARAIPPSQLKTLNWGDVIYLAEFERDEEQGKAIIFGYMSADGLLVQCSDAVRREVHKQFEVVEASVSPQRVSRGCGTYVISGAAYVKDASLAELVKAYEKAAKERGEKIKFLLKGPLTLLGRDIVVEGVRFARGILKVRVPVSELLMAEVLDVLQKYDMQVLYIEDYALNDTTGMRRDARNCASLSFF